MLQNQYWNHPYKNANFSAKKPYRNLEVFTIIAFLQGMMLGEVQGKMGGTSVPCSR